MNDVEKLFGHYSKKSWSDLKAKILIDPTNKINWETATNYLDVRLTTRYFNPIEKIFTMDDKIGEGFAAITLICSLIEFLQSCYEGKIYEHGAKETLNIYSKSGNMFKRFLNQQQPFLTVFTKPTTDVKYPTYADDFYANVRNGLFHEASTKNKWVIRTQCDEATTSSFIDIRNEDCKIIYREKFVDAIKEFTCSYKNQIINNQKDLSGNFLRDNLIMKFDAL